LSLGDQLVKDYEGRPPKFNYGDHDLCDSGRMVYIPNPLPPVSSTINRWNQLLEPVTAGIELCHITTAKQIIADAVAKAEVDG